MQLFNHFGCGEIIKLGFESDNPLYFSCIAVAYCYLAFEFILMLTSVNGKRRFLCEILFTLVNSLTFVQ